MAPRLEPITTWSCSMMRPETSWRTRPLPVSLRHYSIELPADCIHLSVLRGRAGAVFRLHADQWNGGDGEDAGNFGAGPIPDEGRHVDNLRHDSGYHHSTNHLHNRSGPVSRTVP